MTSQQKKITILIADDDPDDRILIQTAFETNNINYTFKYVENGEELIDYLHLQNKFSNKELNPRPNIIILDLNMPRKNGIEALKEIKTNPDLKKIPVIVLTTSNEEIDILESYNIGANSFICKPITFEELIQITSTIIDYWCNMVRLP